MDQSGSTRLSICSTCFQTFYHRCVSFTDTSAVRKELSSLSEREKQVAQLLSEREAEIQQLQRELILGHIFRVHGRLTSKKRKTYTTAIIANGHVHGSVWF